MRRGQATSPFSLFSFQDIITCVSGIIILITLMLVVELVQRDQSSPQVRTHAIASRLREAIAAAQAEIVRLKAALESDSSRVEELAGVSVDLIRRELFDIRSEVEMLEAELVEIESQERKVKKEEQRLQAELFDRMKGEQNRKDLEESTRQLEKQLEELKQTDQLVYNPTTPDGKSVWIAQIGSGRVLVARAGQRQRPEVFESGILNSAANAFNKWLARRSNKQDFFFLLVRPGGADQFDDFRNVLTQHGFSVGFDLLSAKQSAIDPEVGATLP